MKRGAYYNDNDKYCAAWLRNLIAKGLIADGDVDDRDIRDVRPSDLRSYRQVHLFAGLGGWSYALRLAGIPDDRAGWTISCPCQPFSSAGARTGFADERHLWPFVYHLIQQCSPASIVGEQVASPAGYKWLDLVQADMEAADHAFAAAVLPVASVGAPGGRHRIYWMAHANGEPAGRNSGSILRAQAPGACRREDVRRLTDGSRDGCSANELANTNSIRPDGRAARAGRQARSADERHAGAALALANNNNNGREEQPQFHRQSIRPEQQAQRRHDADGCSDIGVAQGDTSGARSQVGSVEALKQRALRIEGAAFGEAEPLRGFWRGADWIWCTDGRYRPVEPGTCPLAHGVSARVGQLRAYGNAINPWAAAAFLEAVTQISIKLQLQ